MAAASALNTSAALDTQPVRAVEVDLNLKFRVEGEQHEITFPRDVKRVDALVESLYLCFGEPPVQSLFNALRQRVRSFQAEFDAIRAEESPDPKVRAEAERARVEHPWLRVLDQKNSRSQRQRRLEIGKVLIRRFMAAWDGIVSLEGNFLRWYERTVFAATRRLLGDKQVVLRKLWEETYRVTPAMPLNEVVEKGIDVSDYVIDPEDSKVREGLFSHTQALAKLWYDYRDTLYSLRELSKQTDSVFAGESRSAKVDASMARVQTAHQNFRNLAATLDTVHPTAIAAAKKFEKVLREPGANAPDDKQKQKDQKASLQRCLVESLVEGYEGTQDFGGDLEESLVFGPQSEALEFDEPDDEYFLRTSTAKLIATRLTGENAWNRDVSLRSVWMQAPIIKRIDKELTPEGATDAPAADLDLARTFLAYLANLNADERRLLAASAVQGTFVNRARIEVQRRIDEIRQRDKERMQNAKQAIFAGGVALAWSTGGSSFVVAGALDAILTLSETWDLVLAYRSSRAKSALVMTSIEEAYWLTPNLCDHVQKISSAIVTIAGDLVNAKGVSHVIDALSMAFMFIDEQPDER